MRVFLGIGSYWRTARPSAEEQVWTPGFTGLIYTFLSSVEPKGNRVIYVILILAAVVAVVIAGRAHSRRLDELDNLHAMGFLNDPAFYRRRRRD